MKLCIATSNRHKLDEIQNLVGDTFTLATLADIGITEELREDYQTFQENSYQKAKYVYDKTGVPCFADDSGLEVEALNGAPGVYSARFAGPEKNDVKNIELLLKKLENSQNRAACFRSVITLLGIGEPHYFEGRIEGAITSVKKGNNGFGYDPVFVPAGYDVTFAEMSLSTKNAISHRAIAVRKLVDFLKSLSV